MKKNLYFLRLVIYGATAITSIYAGSVLATEPPLIVDEAFHTRPIQPIPAPQLPNIQPENALRPSQVGAQIIHDVQIQGGTIFALETLAEWLQPIIGKPAQQDLLVDVLNNITTAYMQAGYPLSYAAIPPGQDLSSGRITIVLVEGYLARSEIVVSEAHIEKRVARHLQYLLNEKPLTQATFERYTTLIESTPGYQFKINVPRPQTISGATTIRVEQVKRERIKAGIALDNAETESNRWFGSVTANSSTSFGDELTISGLVPNGDIDRFYALNYAQYLNSHGLKLSVSGSHFKTDNDDRFFVADIPIDYLEAKTRDQLSVGVSYPIKLSRRHTWWVGSNVQYLDEQALYELQSATTVSTITKDLRYTAFEGFNNMQWNSLRSVTVWRLGLKQGLDLGANKNHIAQAGLTGTGAEDLHFTAFSTDVFWRYRFAQKWQFQSRFNGQWSDDILPSSEQSRYGGIRFARGYPEGNSQGDRGYAGEVELRYFQPVGTRFIRQLEPYVLFDSVHTELRSGESRSSLSSATIGLEITDRQFYGVSLEYSLPTGDKPIDSDDRDPVYNVRLRWQF